VLQLCVLVLCTIHELIEGLQIVIINHFVTYMERLVEVVLFLKQFIYESKCIFSTRDRMNGTAHSVVYNEHSHFTISSQFNIHKRTCTLVINFPFKVWAKYNH
jgi:hypothetical protein